MDAGKNNEVELSRGIQHLEQLVTQGAELLTPVNNELKLVLLRLAALLKKQVKVEIWNRRTTKTKVLDYLKKELQQIPKNDVEENADKKTAQLRKTFRSLVSILATIHAVLRRRGMQIVNLKKKLERELKEATLKKPEEGTKAAEEDNHEKTAVDVFPLEVWQMIGDRLTKSEDLRNLANANVALNAVLERKKTSFLFDQVLPNLVKFLKPQDILNCRQVCKPWREATDAFLETQHLSATGSNNVKLFTELPGMSSIIRFNTEMALHRNSDLNPFPSRALLLNEFHFGNVPVGTYFKEMLPWTGVHVSSLNYCTNRWSIGLMELEEEEDISPQNLIYYLSLRDLLTNLPNLRHLSLTGDLEEVEDSQLMFQTQENIPLPDLPKLETLLIEHNPGDRACRWLIPRYCQQLTELNLEEATTVFQWRWRPELVGNPRDRQTFQFPKLKTLRVGVIDGHRRLTALLTLMEAPELENFLVDRYEPEEDEDLDSENSEAGADIPPAGELLFQILDSFPNLKHLKILGPVRSSLEQVASMHAGDYAPKTLETLELETSTNLSYSFLLRFPYLRHLHLYQKCLTLKRVNEQKIYMASQLEAVILQSLFTFSDNKAAECQGLSEIYSSNIWKLFPSLEEISVKRCTCAGPGEGKEKFVYRREFDEELRKWDRTRLSKSLGGNTVTRSLLK